MPAKSASTCACEAVCTLHEECTRRMCSRNCYNLPYIVLPPQQGSKGRDNLVPCQTVSMKELCPKGLAMSSSLAAAAAATAATVCAGCGLWPSMRPSLFLWLALCGGPAPAMCTHPISPEGMAFADLILQMWQEMYPLRMGELRGHQSCEQCQPHVPQPCFGCADDVGSLWSFSAVSSAMPMCLCHASDVQMLAHCDHALK
eukprot:scaffold38900_cov22-Tisochrysis_lutea.AAC.1